MKKLTFDKERQEKIEEIKSSNKKLLKNAGAYVFDEYPSIILDGSHLNKDSKNDTK